MNPDPRATPEIREAIELLEGYEAAPVSYETATDFSLAIETLEDYLSANPDSPHHQFVQNLRFSYTRRLLQRLSTIDKYDLSLSLEHMKLVLGDVEAEAEKLMGEYPELKKDFDALFKVWAEPLARVILEKEDLEKTRSSTPPADA